MLHSVNYMRFIITCGVCALEAQPITVHVPVQGDAQATHISKGLQRADE
jgi:hypothetical protein